MTDRTLTRVMFEYTDGTGEEIVGPLADEWYRRLLSDGAYLAVHGMGWPRHLSEAWKPVLLVHATVDPSDLVPAPEVTCGTPALEVCVAHCTQERELEVRTARMRAETPDGTPHVRDVLARCADYVPGLPDGRCEGDGHYLCDECKLSAGARVVEIL